MNASPHTVSYDSLTLDELYGILKARSKVFLLEQGIVCQDMDDIDKTAFHVFIEDGGDILAYLRVFPMDGEVHIGRVLTAKEMRGKGLGRSVMEAGLQAAEKHFPGRPVKLHSQSQVVGFYEKMGFRVCSDMFLEEGVPHYEMEK